MTRNAAIWHQVNAKVGKRAKKVLMVIERKRATVPNKKQNLYLHTRLGNEKRLEDVRGKKAVLVNSISF